MNKLLIVCGPTATGKTQLAFDIARQFHGELISSDSRQVYRGLEYLTGKDTSDLEDIPIWLYDVVSIEEEFSVSQYERLANKAIDDVTSRGKLPIVVGGTGLYLKAITLKLSQIHIPPNEVIREKFKDASVEAMQQELQTIDKSKWESMNDSDKKNPRRLIRAIEISLVKPLSISDKEPYDILWIGLIAPKAVLEERVKNRVKNRWDGSVEEMKSLVAEPSKISSTIIGIPIVQKYLQSVLSKEDAFEQWAKKEYQYAKRQLTWFKKQSSIHWYDVTQEGYKKKITQLVSAWYTRGT